LKNVGVTVGNRTPQNARSKKNSSHGQGIQVMKTYESVQSQPPIQPNIARPMVKKVSKKDQIPITSASMIAVQNSSKNSISMNKANGSL
jgi:hypothetical protein